MRPQPSPRSMVVQYLLIAAVVFLGFQLFFPPKAADPRSRDQIWAEMIQLNGDGKDVSIQPELGKYLAKVDADKGAGKLSEDEADRLKTAAYVLVAHTKYKSGLHFAQVPGQTQFAYPKIDRAYQTLLPQYEANRKKAAWSAPVEVVPDKNVTDAEFSADSLYTRLVADLAERNKKELVWGLPGYPLIDSLVRLTGSSPGFSYWFAAFLLALVVRLIIFPLAHRQFMWGRQMQQLQPYIKEIQEKFKDKKTDKVPPDRAQAMQVEVMALYKEYGINPLAGCGPALIQLPLFLFVYQCMVHYRFEFTKGTFLWIEPSVGQKLGFFQLAPNLGYTDHVLVFLYGISLLVSQYLMPVSDPTNVRPQRIMGLAITGIMTVFMFFYPVPSAFVLYWTFANVLSTAQALWTYRLPMAPLQKVQSVKGGTIPTTAQPNGAATVDPGFFGKTGTPKHK